MIPAGDQVSTGDRAVVSGLSGIRRSAHRRLGADRLFYAATALAGLSALIFVLWIGYQLYAVSAPTRHALGWGMLIGTKWDIGRDVYGAFPFIYGSFVSSLIALLVAVPLAVGSAVFLTQFAPPWLSKPLAFFLDLLAAVPSIIFGLWGILVMCPFLLHHVTPWLADRFGAIPLFAGQPSLTNVLAAGLILALMILPFVAAVSREVLYALPQGYKEASMGLGATKWETIRSALLPAATSGILGAAMLGLGRAVGETMAVVMVIGNNTHIHASILVQGYSMPGLLANQFNEAMNVPMQRSALLEIALILFVFTLILNALARLLIYLTAKTRIRREPSGLLLGVKTFTGSAFRAAIYGFALFFVLLQAVADVKSKGLIGILGPVEILAVVYLGLRIASVRLSATRHRRTFRKANDLVMKGGTEIAALLACAGLLMLLGFVLIKGIPGLSVNLFTKLPVAQGEEGGGLKNAILGTLVLVGIASMIGIPLGILGGIFLSEYKESKLVLPVRFASDVLSGIPSVVIGLFAYAAFVLPFGHFSAWAGGAALGVMMIPIVIRVTDEMMRLVPSGMREASMGLGASKMQTILRVVLPACRKGVITGVLLAIARVAGETAPLLFTAFGSNNVPTSLKEPVSALTLKIYEYAGTAYPVNIQQAWAGALVLLLMILVLSLAARFATRSKYA